MRHLKLRRKLLSAALSATMLASVFTVGGFVGASGESVPDKALTDIAGYEDSEITMYDGQDWGLKAGGSRQRVEKDGVSYLKYTTAADFTKSRLSEFAEADKDWTAVRCIDIPVVNESEAACTVLPFYVLNEGEESALYMLNANTYTLMDGAYYTNQWVTQYVSIPAGFQGVLRIPVFASDAGQYTYLEGSQFAWDGTAIDQVGFYFNAPVSGLYLGDVTAVYEEPSRTLIQMTNIAGFTSDEITQGDGQSWGLPDGSKERVEQDGKSYLKVTAPSEGRAVYPLLNYANNKFETIQSVEFEVINTKEEIALVAPYFFLPGIDVPFVAKTGTLYALITDTYTRQVALGDPASMIIPAGFKGRVRINVTADGSGMQKAWEGAGEWSAAEINQIAVGVSAGSVLLLGDLYANHADTVAKEKADVVRISDIAAYSAAEITLDDGQDWGMKGEGHKERVKAGGAYFIQATSTEGGRIPYLLNPLYQDITGIKSLEFAVKNNKDTAATIAPLFFVTQDEPGVSAAFALKPGAAYELMAGDEAAAYVLGDPAVMNIPANFDGVVSINVKDDGADMTAAWEPAGDWDAAKIERISLEISADTILTVGDLAVNYVKTVAAPGTNPDPGPGSDPGPDPGTDPGTKPGEEDKTIVDFDSLTDEQVKEGDGIDWGLPDGSKFKVTVDGKTYIQIVANQAGRAILPQLKKDCYDFTEATAIDIPVVNNKSEKALIAPYFFVGGVTPYITKAGVEYILIAQDGTTTTGKVDDKLMMAIPANFKGTLRVPLSADGGTLQAHWGTGTWDPEIVTQICFEIGANQNISIGEYSLVFGEKENPATGAASAAVPAAILLLAAGAACVLTYRRRKTGC